MGKLMSLTRREFFVSAVAAATQAAAFPGLALGLDPRSSIATSEMGSSAEFALPPGTPILVDSAEAEPIHAAIQDLQRDLQKVIGAKSEIVSRSSEIATRAAIVVTCKGPETARFRTPSLADAESHELRAEGNHSTPRIVLQGSDMRGTIYAIYEFSKAYLNVPPLWYWSSWQPQQISHIAFPASLKMRFAAPEMRYRVWFPNDEDMLASWMKLSTDNFKALFETLLRLKYNTLNVSTISEYGGIPNKGLRWARECKRRGIIVTFTHHAPFGADIGDWKNYWPQVIGGTPPELEFSTTGELTPMLISKLEEFWKYYIRLAQREGFEVIETIVFRGHFDHPYWNVFRNAPTGDRARGNYQSGIAHSGRAIEKHMGSARESASCDADHFLLRSCGFHGERTPASARGSGPDMELLEPTARSCARCGHSALSI